MVRGIGCILGWIYSLKLVFQADLCQSCSGEDSDLPPRARDKGLREHSGKQDTFLIFSEGIRARTYGGHNLPLGKENL